MIPESLKLLLQPWLKKIDAEPLIEYIRQQLQYAPAHMEHRTRRLSLLKRMLQAPEHHYHAIAVLFGVVGDVNALEADGALSANAPALAYLFVEDAEAALLLDGDDELAYTKFQKNATTLLHFSNSADPLQHVGLYRAISC